MTTIAWDGKSVAADTQAESGRYRVPGPVHKILRVKDVVYAVAGFSVMLEPLIKWHQSGANPQDIPKVEDKEVSSSVAFLVFFEDRCQMYRLDVPFPEEIIAPDAWGTGSYFAIGAMKAGADARRAVEISIDCNPNTGGKVIVEKL